MPAALELDFDGGFGVLARRNRSRERRRTAVR